MVIACAGLLASHEGRRHDRQRRCRQAPAGCAVLGLLLLAGSASGGDYVILKGHAVSDSIAGVLAGDAVELLMEFNPFPSDKDPSASDGINPVGAQGAVTLYVDRGDLLITYVTGCHSGGIGVANADTDSLVFSGGTCSDVYSRHVDAIGAVLEDPTGIAFVSDGFPRSIHLDSFATAHIIQGGGQGGTFNGDLFATVDEAFVAIPEPAAGCGAVALLALAAVRRRNAAC